MDITLTHKQWEAMEILHDKITTELLFGGGAGGAKTFFGCVWLIQCAIDYPGSRGLMGRSKLKSLKETTLNTFWDVVALMGIKDHIKYNGQLGVLTFSNGSEIILKDLFLYPTDPKFDSLGSLELTYAFVDEANQITLKAKNVLKSRIRYKLDDFGLIPKLLLTCNPAKNWTYSDFYKPSLDGSLPEYRKFIQALLTDNPHMTVHYRESLLTLDADSKQRLLFGNWNYSSDPSVMCAFDNIVDLWHNSHVQDKGQLWYMTIDVARLGKDKTVIMIWDGWVVKKIVVIPICNLLELGERVTILKNEYGIPNSRIVADESGVGGGLVDFLYLQGFTGGSKAANDENYQNLRTQCFYKLAGQINDAAIYIEDPLDRDLIVEELEQLKTYKIDSDGKLRILPKDQVKEAIGRSPDYSDTLSMRLWFETEGAPSGHINF